MTQSPVAVQGVPEKRKPGRRSTIIWVLVILLVCSLIFWHDCISRFIPRPISPQNRPSCFFVIGLAKPEKPVLLLRERSSEYVLKPRLHYESRAAFRKQWVVDHGEKAVLWREDERPGGPYTFYIHKRDLGAVTKTLKTSPSWPHSTTTLLADNPRAKRQTVRLTCDSGDSLHVCIYAVEGNRIRALRYTYNRYGYAMMALFNSALAVMLILGTRWIGLAILRARRRRKAAT